VAYARVAQSFILWWKEWYIICHFTFQKTSLSPHLAPKFQLKTQSVPRSKRTPSRLYKPVSQFWYFADRASQYIYLNINQLDALNFIMSLFHASTCFEHLCSSSGGQNCTIQSLVSSHSVGDSPVHRTATYRCDDTRDCIIQFWPPDDEHMYSKHVEAWNKLIIKFSASSWLILR